jgi:ISXO2 transposase-like protein
MGNFSERQIRLVETGSCLTDETNIYSAIRVKGEQQVAGMERQSVNHGSGEVYTNMAEGFISLLKRGIVGTLHHIGKRHRGKYVSEFEFR